MCRESIHHHVRAVEDVCKGILERVDLGAERGELPGGRGVDVARSDTNGRESRAVFGEEALREEETYGVSERLCLATA